MTPSPALDADSTPQRSGVDALRALTRLLGATLALSVVLGVLAASIVLLGGGAPTAATADIPGGPAAPALTLLGSAQLATLVGAGLAAAAYLAVLRGADPVSLLPRVQARVRVVGIAHLVLCAVLTVAWLVLVPHLWAVVLGCALVAAQGGVGLNVVGNPGLLGRLRRRGRRERG